MMIDTSLILHYITMALNLKQKGGRGRPIEALWNSTTSVGGHSSTLDGRIRILRAYFYPLSSPSILLDSSQLLEK